MEKKCSIGVKICGIMMLCYGLWLLVGSGVFPPLNRLFWYIFRDSLKIIFPEPLMIIFISGPLRLLIAVVASISLVCSIGILRLKNWARLLTICFTSLLLLPCSYIIVRLIIFTIQGGYKGPQAIGYLPLLLVIPYIPFYAPLIYFTRPKVKEQFKCSK